MDFRNKRQDNTPPKKIRKNKKVKKTKTLFYLIPQSSMTYINIPKQKKIETKIPLSGTKRKKIETKSRLLVKWRTNSHYQQKSLKLSNVYALCSKNYVDNPNARILH